jgi:hypothetical protein
VNHFAGAEFWFHYRRLPPEIRDVADEKFELLKRNARHPSLHLKKVGRYFSVRVGLAHRALGVDVEDGILWFWIGSHDDYDRRIG